MRRISPLLALVLVVGACSPGDQGSTTTAAESSTTTTPSDTTSSSPETTTSTPGETTTSEGDGPQVEGVRFVFNTVELGDGAMLVITNVGSEDGNLGGHALCQRPSYWTFSDFEVPAGESVAISLGGSTFEPPEGVLVIEESARVGVLSPDSGEIALYTSSNFSSSEQILSYVEWGSSGHGRSSVAVGAGIWDEGGFVATTESTTTLTASTLPTASSDDWTAN